MSSSDESHSAEQVLPPSMPLAMPSDARRLSASERWLCLGTAVGILFVFAVALWLQPDVRGHSTHTQLGLQDCGMVRFFGLPCPFCGMTTSFSLMVRGRFYEGFLAQPAGSGLFVVALALVPALLVLAAVGWRPPCLSHRRGRFLLILGVAGLALAWAYKLVTFTA